MQASLSDKNLFKGVVQLKTKRGRKKAQMTDIGSEIGAARYLFIFIFKCESFFGHFVQIKFTFYSFKLFALKSQ
jgi:hypothetical protein